MLKRLRLILEMIRFSHTLFALPFALLAGVMAWSESARSTDGEAIGWRPWLGILLCMVTARSAAMAFNRLVDRRLDAQNPRTAQAAPAGRFIVDRQRDAVYRGLGRRICGLDAVVFAESVAALSCRCRCSHFCAAIALPNGSPAWPIFGSAPL